MVKDGRVRMLILVLLVLIALGAVFPRSPLAQAWQGKSDIPLVLLSEGDLWTLTVSDGTLTSLTHDGHVQGAWISPDNIHIAYLTWPAITIDAIQRVGGIGGGHLPLDIRIVNRQTGVDMPVAVQPPDAVLFSESETDNAWQRSAPAWSPDGAHLAWAEVHYPSFDQETNRLMIYDMNTHKTRILVTHLPSMAGIPGPQSVMWGNGGVTVDAATFYLATDGSRSDYTAVLVYDINSMLVSETRFQYGDVPARERAIQFEWMTQQGRPYIAVRFADDHWQLFDPITNSPLAIMGAPELYSSSAPGGLAARLTLDPLADYNTKYNWTLINQGQQVIGTLDYHQHEIAIAPDGQSLAYMQADQLIIWDNGVQQPGIIVEEHVAAVLWGPTAWRIEPAPVMNCPGALPARVVVGGQAWVIPNTSPNNLRDQPASTGALLVQLPAGEPFAVVGGPQCADGLTWWQVNYTETIGWTAEGDSNTYWVEPLDYATYEH